MIQGWVESKPNTYPSFNNIVSSDTFVSSEVKEHTYILHIIYKYIICMVFL